LQCSTAVLADRKPSAALLAFAATIVAIAFLYIDPIVDISCSLSSALSCKIHKESIQRYRSLSARVTRIASDIVFGKKLMGIAPVKALMVVEVVVTLCRPPQQ
jgi:hypothetical protein